MQRDASRVLLEITSIRREHLRQISARDALAEGCPADHQSDPLKWFVDLWDRGLRAREEGRPGPFAQRQQPPEVKKPAKPKDRVLIVTAFRDPMKEMDKLHDLYDTLREARAELGEENVPFHKFAELVKGQVAKLKKDGAPEVAFRVSVKDGKLNLTAKGLKGAK